MHAFCNRIADTKLKLGPPPFVLYGESWPLKIDFQAPLWEVGQLGEGIWPLFGESLSISGSTVPIQTVP